MAKNIIKNVHMHTPGNISNKMSSGDQFSDRKSSLLEPLFEEQQQQNVQERSESRPDIEFSEEKALESKSPGSVMINMNEIQMQETMSASSSIDCDAGINPNSDHWIEIREDTDQGPRQEKVRNGSVDMSQSFLISRLGVPNEDIQDYKDQLSESLETKVEDLVDLFNDFFVLKNGILTLKEAQLDFVHENGDLSLRGIEAQLNTKKEEEDFFKDVLEVFYAAKSIKLLCPYGLKVDGIREPFQFLKSIFNALLSTFTNSEYDSVPLVDLKVLMIMGLLLTALSEFIGEAEHTEMEPVFSYLLASLDVDQVTAIFSDIIPPAYQSRLFILTIYRDLQKVEANIITEETNLSGQLKAIIELAFKRYGNFFFKYYGDDVMYFLNQKDLLDCPVALWDKATLGKDDIQLEIGPSFLINMIKYQWGILKDFNGIVPDPTLKCIYWDNEVENLYDFLTEQAMQLFLFIGALNTVLADEEMERLSYTNDIDLLVLIYTELMDHLVRICTALDDNYTVKQQDDSIEASLIEQLCWKQYVKGYILLMTICLCNLQLVLTGPLQIATAPSISTVIEYYISKSDFSYPLKECELSQRFTQEFKAQSQSLIRSYSFIRSLSPNILIRLEGSEKVKVTALNTNISWTMLMFSILMILLVSYQFLTLIQYLWNLANDLIFI